VRGKISLNEGLTYMGCQLAGALVAALLVGIFVPIPDTALQELNITKALVAELLGTFALAYVVLNVATAKSNSGNSYYGLAIGFTVFAMAVCFGGHSGGAFNPAVAIGASIMKMFAWKNIWIYIAACFGGGILAGFVFNMNNPDDK
jgi:aquaporin Z